MVKMTYFYIFMEWICGAIRNWLHKDIFNYHIVYNDMCFETDITKHDEEREHFRTVVLKRKKQQVDQEFVYHHTVEKDKQRSEELLKHETDEELRKWWQKNYDNPKEHWEYTGVKYFRRGITDKIRRYFILSCCPPVKYKYKKRNYLSRNWIHMCDFFERLERYFYERI